MVKKLLILSTVAVVALYGVVDMAAKGLAEDKIAERVESAVGGRATATANVDSFPFLLRLLANGNAGDISIRITDVAHPALSFAAAELSLQGVTLDRGKLLGQRKAEVTDIESGTLTLEVAAAEVSKALRNLPVSIAGGRVEVQVAGRARAADVSLGAGGAIRVAVPQGPSVDIEVPRTALGSCGATALRVDDDRLVLSCTLTEVPPALLAAAQR
ncbi:MAG: DUF2993 domain-containing protein [Actinobacteria bacterium]|nr:DUF2993 domain-containing protein [Actinomycetota bacterium]